MADEGLERIVELVHERDRIIAEENNLVARVQQLRAQRAAVEAELRGGQSAALVPAGVQAPKFPKVKDLVLWWYREFPGIDIADVTTRVYGADDDTTRARCRMALNSLCKDGLLEKRPGINQGWRATAKALKDESAAAGLNGGAHTNG